MTACARAKPGKKEEWRPKYTRVEARLNGAYIFMRTVRFFGFYASLAMRVMCGGGAFCFFFFFLHFVLVFVLYIYALCFRFADGAIVFMPSTPGVAKCGRIDVVWHDLRRTPQYCNGCVE